MNTHKHRPESGKSAMKSSTNTSMISAASGFMFLMLVVTAPAGPGPAPVLDHGPDLFRAMYPPRFPVFLLACQEKDPARPPTLPWHGSGL
jgi:hypothetical protein